MELFAADGHDAGGCERVTGKSGMRPFDPALANGWYDGLADDQRDALDSIAANRNQLAHGASIGLSLGRLTSYTDRARNAMCELDRRFD